MNLTRLLIFFLVPGIAVSETLVRNHDATNPCQAYGCKYYEWNLAPLDDVRFVASGYEDGIDYSFYRVSDAGDYELLLRVNPIVVDSEGRYWWGYPWVISDIARHESPCGLFFSATFEHEIERDGNISIPEWQRRLPAILFIGEKGDWNVEQSKLDFRPAKIEELIEQASEG